MLQLLNHERKSLKKRIKAHIENSREQVQQYSNANLAAANLQAMRDTTLKYIEEGVRKGITSLVLFSFLSFLSFLSSLSSLSL